MAGVRGDLGITEPQSSSRAGEHAVEPAEAREIELAVPLGGKTQGKDDLRIDMAVHVAILGESAAGSDHRGRRDRGARDCQARQPAAVCSARRPRGPEQTQERHCRQYGHYHATHGPPPLEPSARAESEVWILDPYADGRVGGFRELASPLAGSCQVSLLSASPVPR